MLEIKDLHVSVAGGTEIIKGLNLTIPSEKFMRSWVQMVQGKVRFHMF